MDNIFSVGVEKEDMLWTEKYQPQDSSELVGNKKEIERLHRSEVGTGSIPEITQNLVLLDNAQVQREQSLSVLPYKHPDHDLAVLPAFHRNLALNST